MINGSVSNDLKRVFLTRFKVATANINKNKLYNIKTVDVAISIRSTKPFFRTKANNRNKAVMNETKRQRKDNDRYFRDTIIVTAFARNLGVQ